MAASVYFCINCGAGVRFDIAAKSFICEHCNSRYSLEEMSKAFPDDEDGSLWKSVVENAAQTDSVEQRWVSQSETKEAQLKIHVGPACAAEPLDSV
ncbi:MAG: hypothetical protein LBS19_12865 [Clostridiales bacterium]|jgi:DNA-directed RNA polymerase subunit RPC12/RpoP|nr:hypothetical protein [Clostridiales bacterium]